MIIGIPIENVIRLYSAPLTWHLSNCSFAIKRNNWTYNTNLLIIIQKIF